MDFCRSTLRGEALPFGQLGKAVSVAVVCCILSAGLAAPTLVRAEDDSATTGGGATGEASQGATPEELAAVKVSGEYQDHVTSRWDEFLEGKGLREGINKDNWFIASGTEVVTIPQGQPGWIEARRVAFQVASLRAKAQLVSFIAQRVQRTSDFTLIENPVFEHGHVETLEGLDQASRIMRKAGDFTEATLDAAIRELDPEYDAEQYEQGNIDEKRALLEQVYNDRVTLAASRSIGGALTMNVIEGPTATGQGHQILVGVIWTPALGRLALQIDDGRYGVSLDEAKKDIAERVPQTVGEAVASFGTRVIVDEGGQRALIAYGQAEPADVGPSEEDRAVLAAMQRAEALAQANIASFVGERLSLRQSVESQALAKAYAGLAQQGSRIDVNSTTKIRAASRPVELRGVETLWRQVVEHPATGQKVAIAMKVWSPSGHEAAKNVGAAVENEGSDTADTGEGDARADDESSSDSIILEREGNDESAY